MSEPDQTATDIGSKILNIGGKILSVATNPVLDTAKDLAQAGLFLAAGGAAAAKFQSTNEQLRAAETGVSSSRGDLPFVSNSKNHRMWIVNNFADKPNATIIKAWMPEQVSLDVTATYSAILGQGIFGKDDYFSLGMRGMGFTGLSQFMSYKIWTNSQGITMSIPIVFTADDTLLESDVVNGASKSAGFADYDIMGPIIELQRMCLPSNVPGTLFLEPPGTVVTFSPLKALSKLGEAAGISAKKIEGTARTTAQAIDAVTGSKLEKSIDQGPQKASSEVKYLSDTAFEAVGFGIRSWTSVYLGEFLYFDKVVIEGVSAAYDMQLDARGKPIKATVNVTFSTLFDATVQDLNSIYMTDRVTDPNVKSNPSARA